MINPVRVRNTMIGEGVPKLIVPIVSDSDETVLKSAELIAEKDVDLVEWRADFYDHCTNVYSVIEVLAEMRRILGEKAIVFTIRTRQEGGARDISISEYVAINKAVAESRLADLIDIELFIGNDIISELVSGIQATGTKVVVSNHDFTKTPDRGELVRRFQAMQHLGGDILKIAVMPNSVADVITLLAATNEMVTLHASSPVLAISMSGQGVVTRVAGEIFGSCMSFGSVGKTSAPGQIPVDELATILRIVHEAL